MINIAHGNLLTANVDALVNTVNTEGVMGKGIALQFKRAYPRVYDLYRADCKAGLVDVGTMHVVDIGAIGGGPRWVINFPTKRHWKAKSKIEDIRLGLVALRREIVERGITSIAIPPLGCGHGGLSWSVVEPLIRSELGSLSSVRVELFAPSGAPEAASMPNATEKPDLTPGAAAVVALMSRYKSAMLDPIISLLEVHKLMYFLQEAGEPLKLKYDKGAFGPYSPTLRHVLNRVEGHYLTGYGDGQDKPTKAIDFLGNAEDEALEFLADRFSTQANMERVAALIDGYEDPYGLELLGSVHWVMMHDPATVHSVERAIEAVHAWNDRKATLMKPEHVKRAWSRLKSQEWDTLSRSAAH
jgi:O-acetyl-ADP-ribose deacetylase (regulator of RNase III)